MKAILCAILSAVAVGSTNAASTINTTDSFAWSANAGWVNWRGDGANGAVIGEYIISGFISVANLGWIKLGSGAAANGIRYANNSATDFGVNVMSDGTLRGFAYGANIGWVNFEPLGNPRVDLGTGIFSGYAWSANVGWINLGDATWHPVTDSIVAGADTDGDGLTDAWELEYAGNLITLTATGDADQDVTSDLDEYIARTDPVDPNSRFTLRIAPAPDPFNPGQFLSGQKALIFSPRFTNRNYVVKFKLDLTDATWSPLTSSTFTDNGKQRTVTDLSATEAKKFYQVEITKP